MTNRFIHQELNTGDLAKAKKFYGKLFGWTLVDLPIGYTMIHDGKDAIGGMQKAPQGMHAGWLSYVEVVDVDKTLAAAAKGGANVVMARHDMGDMGAIGVFIDPTGVALGVWQAAKKQAPAPKKAAAKKAPAKKAAPVAKKASKKPAKKK